MFFATFLAFFFDNLPTTTTKKMVFTVHNLRRQSLKASFEKTNRLIIRKVINLRAALDSVSLNFFLHYTVYFTANGSISEKLPFFRLTKTPQSQGFLRVEQFLSYCTWRRVMTGSSSFLFRAVADMRLK